MATKNMMTEIATIPRDGLFGSIMIPSVEQQTSQAY
jgi:hypothetical protein